jgi:succinate dehydrogenase / fumarate reductase, cytochrome b subunit
LRRFDTTPPAEILVHPADRGPRSLFTSWLPSQFGGSYRYFTGSLAYVLHRVSGIALLFYLIFHITSITEASTADPSRYDVLMRRFQEPDFKLGEVMLYGALLFHGLNGIRILLVDFVIDRTHVQKKLFWCAALLTAGLFVIGAIPLVLHSNVQPLFVHDHLPGGR